MRTFPLRNLKNLNLLTFNPEKHLPVITHSKNLYPKPPLWDPSNKKTPSPPIQLNFALKYSTSIGTSILRISPLVSPPLTTTLRSSLLTWFAVLMSIPFLMWSRALSRFPDLAARRKLVAASACNKHKTNSQQTCCDITDLFQQQHWKEEAQQQKHFRKSSRCHTERQRQRERERESERGHKSNAKVCRDKQENLFFVLCRKTGTWNMGS